MIFSKATKVLKQLGLINNKFQLPTGILAELSGLSRYQARAAIKTLPAAVREIKKLKLLKYGERIDFEVFDEEGTPIDQITENSTGVSYFYIFKYQTPRDEPDEVKGFTTAGDETGETETYNKPEYDKSNDPYLADKQKELSRLNKYFPGNEHMKLIYFELDDITKAVDHYEVALQEKKDIAQNQRREVDKVQLNYMWFKMSIEGQYWKTKFTPKQKVQNEVDKLKITIGKIRSFVTDQKIKTPLTLIHKDKPLHRWSDFNSAAAFYNQVYMQYVKLDENIQKEIYNLAGKYYRHENTKPVDKRDPITHDKEEAKTKLQQIISIVHTNFI